MASMPLAENKFIYKKQWVYLVSDKPYDYTEARRYCLSQGYAIVPYQDKIINGEYGTDPVVGPH